jgi:hypothetical protein
MPNDSAPNPARNPHRRGNHARGYVVGTLAAVAAATGVGAVVANTEQRSPSYIAATEACASQLTNKKVHLTTLDGDFTVPRAILPEVQACQNVGNDPLQAQQVLHEADERLASQG